MIPPGAIRYYANIPKLLLFLVMFGGFAVIGWRMWITQHSTKEAVVGIAALGFGGFGALAFFYWLVITAIVRKPLLEFDEAGVRSSLSLYPWRATFIPWMCIQRLGILAQMGHNSSYYFVVNARVYKVSNASRRGIAAKLYPALDHAAICVRLNSVFLFASRQRRADMLERIKATFAQEITQHQVDVDMEERPL